MKRIIICLLAALLLAACKPTPKEDVIVNKGDADLAEAVKLPETGESTQDLTKIPAHLELTEQPQKNVKVVVDADVLLERDASYPLIEVVPYDTLHDPTFYRTLRDQICPGGTVYAHWQRTKDDVGEELKAALSYHGQAGSLIDEDTLRETYIPMMEAEFQNAPTVADKKQHDDSAGFENQQYYYIEKPSGEVAWIFFSGVNGGDYSDKSRMSYVDEDSLETGDEPIAEPRISEQDAITIADAFLQKMGVECNALTETKKGFTFFNYERGDSIWMLYYTRKIDGTLSLNRYDILSYSPPVSPASTVGAPWMIESVMVAVGPNGIVFVDWSGLAKTSKVLSADTPLCSFDTITRRMVEQLGFEYAYTTQNGVDLVDSELQVQKIRLIYALLCEKDRYGVGVYMPVWEITYVTAALPEDVRQLYLSAIDGGAVEPRMTREALMTVPE